MSSNDDRTAGVVCDEETEQMIRDMLEDLDTDRSVDEQLARLARGDVAGITMPAMPATCDMPLSNGELERRLASIERDHGENQ